MTSRLTRFTGVAMLLPVGLWAHSGEALQPHDLWTTWEFDPGTVIPLLASAVLYWRGSTRSRGLPQWQKICFWTGLLALSLALISPLHPLGEALFSAHMLQHEILMLVAAPLLTLSRPLVPMLWGMPLNWRRALGAWSKASPVQSLWVWLTRPAVAGTIHGLAIWVWHLPDLFQSTLTSQFMHAAQHISFFGSALLFWWSLFHARGKESYGAGVLYLFATAVHTSALGALLTFSRSVWYPAYQNTVGAWNLSALEDQQLGGLVMWVPGGIVYLAGALVMMAAWLKESDRIPNGRSYAA